MKQSSSICLFQTCKHFSIHHYLCRWWLSPRDFGNQTSVFLQELSIESVWRHTFSQFKFWYEWNTDIYDMIPWWKILPVSPNGDASWLMREILRASCLEHGRQHVAVILVQLNNLDFTVCEFQVTSLFKLLMINEGCWKPFNWKIHSTSARHVKSGDITTKDFTKVHACQVHARRRKSIKCKAHARSVPSWMPMSKGWKIKAAQEERARRFTTQAPFVLKQTKVTTRCHQPTLKSKRSLRPTMKVREWRTRFSNFVSCVVGFNFFLKRFVLLCFQWQLVWMVLFFFWVVGAVGAGSRLNYAYHNVDGIKNDLMQPDAACRLNCFIKHFGWGQAFGWNKTGILVAERGPQCGAHL